MSFLFQMVMYEGEVMNRGRRKIKFLEKEENLIFMSHFHFYI